MEEKQEILRKLAFIKENGEFSPEEVETLIAYMGSEDEVIRAAAVLSVDDILYDTRILDQLFYLFEMEHNFSVKKALIKQLGNFVSAGFLEGFEDDSDRDLFPDDSDNYTESMEISLKERYVQAKNLLFNYLVQFDEFDELYFDVIEALCVFGEEPSLKTRIVELWDVEDNERINKMMAVFTQYPAAYKAQLDELLETGKSVSLIMQAMEAAYRAADEHTTRLLEGYLESPHTDLVKKSLTVLARINKTPELGDLLQKFCLHENEEIRLAAKKALDIFASRNFDNFMNDYF